VRRHILKALDVVKANLKNAEALILIMNDVVAKKVMVAWRIYGPEFADPEFNSKLDLRVQLARLWEGVGPIDMNRLAEIAGVPMTRAVKAFARLRAAHLIWPDGSSTEDARRIVIADVQGYVRPLMPRAPAADKPKDKGTTDDGQRPSNKTPENDRKRRSVKTRR
jgi:hypothetical protein